MINGHVTFKRPEECTVRKYVRDMGIKKFGDQNFRGVEAEAAELEN